MPASPDVVVRVRADRVERAAAADAGRLRSLLRESRALLGTPHQVIAGPNAGVKEFGGVAYYDEDLIPDPDCPVCALERAIDEALA